ncbi:LysR family transcriptional regulator [Paracoccus benzoatiresistens]|uniref:LysR family transcriptional regulator n=1 Tax=Paracoccus benzoatiresistens TaxID=2997341 RepID=A0ABT4J9N0_9RHOB|nr:LysR family transcriptional regulator [Paracoccus sp. EF6]MCZ0963793.1 LysR family transcriptional regulator [Paracoccus sp. EF6]
MLNEIDLSRTDLNLLVIFEAVMRERNVARAAARLNLTASAVSHGRGRLRRLLNDPLFLRTPRGVVTTARAEELAVPVAKILAHIRRVVAMAKPFDPKTSARRFIIGAADGVAAVLAREVLEEVERGAPRVGLGLRQLMVGRSRLYDRVWDDLLQILEAHEIDLAIPSRTIPPSITIAACVTFWFRRLRISLGLPTRRLKSSGVGVRSRRRCRTS